MTTVLEQLTETQRFVQQEQSPELRLFTVQEYARLIEAGILGEDERLELLEGRIVRMSPKGIRHAAANDRASKCFMKHLGSRVIVRNQNPIHLNESSEPEPDLVLAAPQEKEYFDHHPTPQEVLLLIEIADSSLHVDRATKSRLYATAGIIQYCVLNLKVGELEDYREPDAEGYRSKQTYTADQSFSLEAFPEVTIKVSELLPPE
jgi:Uma2 family endonuclease